VCLYVDVFQMAKIVRFDVEKVSARAMRKRRVRKPGSSAHGSEQFFPLQVCVTLPQEEKPLLPRSRRVPCSTFGSRKPGGWLYMVTQLGDGGKKDHRVEVLGSKTGYHYWTSPLQKLFSHPLPPPSP
jgi:hypothetical protein